jgi:hypothetical protein
MKSTTHSRGARVSLQFGVLLLLLLIRRQAQAQAQAQARHRERRKEYVEQVIRKLNVLSAIPDRPFS